MAFFFGISPGEEKRHEGLRVKVTPDGEEVWMHGKWLGLGEDHAVIVSTEKVSFFTPGGVLKRLGQFPAWVVIGTGRGRKRAVAIKTNICQFRGGVIQIGKTRHPIPLRAMHINQPRDILRQSYAQRLG